MIIYPYGREPRPAARRSTIRRPGGYALVMLSHFRAQDNWSDLLLLCLLLLFVAVFLVGLGLLAEKPGCACDGCVQQRAEPPAPNGGVWFPRG